MSRDALDFGRPLEEVAAAFRPAERELFADVLRRLASLYGSRIESVKLVGSRARGTAMERSDYDFLVFLAGCDGEAEDPRLTEIGYELTLKHGLGGVSLSPLAPERFHTLDEKYPGITDGFRRDAVDLLSRVRSPPTVEGR